VPPSWNALKRLLADERLPAALVDLDAVDRNVDLLRGIAERQGKTLRIASKSIRHVGLIRRVLERGGPAFQGLMCFTAEEATALADAGLDDLLVAYPTVQRGPLTALGERVARGATIHVVVDHPTHLSALDAAGKAAGATLSAIIELDVSARFMGAVHLGARRSPLRTGADCVALARAAEGLPRVRIGGLMAYEGHIASLVDTPLHRNFKRLVGPRVARGRAAAVTALRAAGFELPLVNGGGTGSAHRTAAEGCVTEITAGSAFLCPHLFDGFDDLPLEPAAWFALRVCRCSDPKMVTCAGGGYVASGEAGRSRLPIPVLPEGLSLIGLEGAGEVQTPLRCRGPVPEIGDPVLFRHAKAGELAERFATYLLLREGELVAREPTYRGQGWCFL